MMETKAEFLDELNHQKNLLNIVIEHVRNRESAILRQGDFAPPFFAMELKSNLKNALAIKKKVINLFDTFINNDLGEKKGEGLIITRIVEIEEILDSSTCTILSKLLNSLIHTIGNSEKTNIKEGFIFSEITKKKVQGLIANNKTKQALELLLEHNFDDIELNNIITILSSSYHRVQKGFNIKTISNEEYNLTLNRINYAILDLSIQE